MSKLHIFPNPRLSAFPLFLLHSPSFLFPHRRRNAVRPPSLCSRGNRHFKVRAKGNSPPGVRWLGIDADCGGDGGEELESPVDLCVTYELQPALTLRDGVRRIKEAVAEMKAKPPCCASGVVRFQVRIPPSITAVNWFCSQVKFSGVFPHFLIFLKNNEEVMEMASLDGMIGVSGVGAAIYLQGHSYATTEKNLIRYLSVDSTLIRAYGFIGINDMEETFPANHKNEPHQIFIPQIELDEFESGSMLASTVIWDIHRLHKLQHAIQSVEFYLDKITCFGLSTNAPFNDKDIYEEDDLMLIKDAKMVYLHAENLVTQDTNSNGSQLEIFQDFFQSYFRLSDTLAYKNRMVTYSCESKFSIKDCPDINAVWSSLIVEECVRLGLKYFCVAPGSRSSPLAICAARHPLTTCTSCFDERSLAFHAVGYGKGSLKPAVVITTSGTAVSNLLPAVVEASQSFVPLLLLTADRPPELQDNGANQSINQVDHFGKFVRYFFGLPPPSGEIPARMVLTTIDSAVYHATQVPCGPVHINCPFRETLEDYPSEWKFNCLKGLDKWISDSKPFTTYVNIQNFCSLAEHPSQVSEVLNFIERAERGLLLLGTMDTEDEIWAALLLARHLSWPVVADILSGMRLRRTFSSLQIDSQLLFIDHLDHALLSESFTKWVKPDVVLQLGSRLTSKRVSQFLESCSPSAYILVDKHPYRHDPSHIVTQRIQSTVCAIAEALLNIQFTRKMVNWCNFLQAMDVTISQELSHQICLEDSLTEPYVAHIISEALQNGVLFVGNSMVIRDIDMYGKGLVESISTFAPLSQDFPYQGIQVVGNRGVSGIDGLLSSACGFAVGRSKRVICVIGDVSFLHDTNGLAILSERMQRKPITILVMNNHGGAIFSFLPIAERTKSSILKKYFYASHDISIGNLCAAHSIKYLHVQTKGELHHALSESQQCSRDCVIEVESCISDNSNFHSVLRKSACQAVNQALNTLLLIRDHRNVDFSFLRIEKIEYSLYRIQLSSILTTTPITSEGKLDKKGFVLAITLSDGTRGFGEVAPIEIHKEEIEEVEEQLRFVIHMIEGSKINFLPSLCNGFFSSWFWRILGLTPSSLFPSVRCGIEMALLHALANKQDANAADVFQRSENLFSGLTSLSASKEGKNIERPTHVEICALVDCSGTPSEVSHVVSQLVHECFTTIKLKVARRSNPIDDATVIQKIRNKVGYKVNIRVDANRKWTYEEAVLFGSRVQNFGLQYIEEPVQFEDDIIKFCEVTGLPVALDETVDNLKDDIVNKLKKFNHPGVVAIVIKPSVVGGFENAKLIASWALKHQKMAIISSAFESSLSLSVYSQFAVYLEHQKIALCKTAGFNPAVAHGLGTYKWLSEDIGIKPFRNYIHPHCGALGISEKDSCAMLRNFQINDKVIQRSYSGEQLISYFSTINYHDCTFSMRLLETKSSMDNITTVFLHGYLGTSEEWIPIMKALSAKSKCISIELPGHGQSKIQWNKEKEMSKEYQISIELVGDILHELLCGVATGGVVLVGYSMGARIALYMSLKYNDKIKGAVLISGTPGLKDEASRKVRVDQDDAKAHFLSTHGLHHFIEIWYRSNLWNSLRCHPHFDRIKSARKKHDDIHAVAKALSDMSVGRQSSLWKELNYCSQPILLVVGEKDRKFKNIAHEMCKEIRSRDTDWNDVSAKLCTVVEVPECGHAVHLENPLVVINAVSKFLTKVRTE